MNAIRIRVEQVHVIHVKCELHYSSGFCDRAWRSTRPYVLSADLEVHHGIYARRLQYAHFRREIDLRRMSVRPSFSDALRTDPEDHFRQFMLNGLSYVGIRRVSEMLKEIDSKESSRLEREAEAWKQDIRANPREQDQMLMLLLLLEMGSPASRR